MRNRPVSLSTLLAAAACLVAAPVAAQQAQPTAGPTPGPTPGMRYLTWTGKTGSSAPQRPTPVATTSDGLRRPASIIARRPVDSSAPPVTASPSAARPSRYGSASSSGLTPASEWMATPAPQPTPSAGENTATPYVLAPPRPLAEVRASALAPNPAYEASVASPTQPLAVAAAPEAQPATSAFDPMAPRRDAMIYRMQGARATDQAPTAPTSPPSSASPQPQPTAPRPSPYALADQGRGGARYYSVHRAAGHQPDPTVIPEAVYLDSAPIDLAEPPPTPVVPRTINGRAQVIVPNEDPSLP